MSERAYAGTFPCLQAGGRENEGKGSGETADWKAGGMERLKEEPMKRDRLQKRGSFLSMLFCAALFPLTLVIAGFITPTFADESISVSCYKDAKSSWSVGKVVVFDVAEAAQACNSMYYDCRGKCIGCYQDFDYVDNVCVDMRGNTFLK
jgi:hypothetical protein